MTLSLESSSMALVLFMQNVLALLIKFVVLSIFIVYPNALVRFAVPVVIISLSLLIGFLFLFDLRITYKLYMAYFLILFPANSTYNKLSFLIDLSYDTNKSISLLLILLYLIYNNFKFLACTNWLTILLKLSLLILLFDILRRYNR